MNIGHAFATAWKDLKAGATLAQSFLSTHGSEIQADVAIASKLVVAVDPALSPAVTVFDKIEEAVMGEVTAAVSAIATAPDPNGFFTVTLPASIFPTVKAISSQLAHPVEAAKAVNPPAAV